MAHHRNAQHVTETLKGKLKMRIVTIDLQSITTYTSSKNVVKDLQKGENDDAHEKRRWREKAHADSDGNVFIPAVAFKMALDQTVKLLNEKIRGKGNQTWSKTFATGVGVGPNDLMLGLKLDDLKCTVVFVNADGVRGSGKRVFRYFPSVPQWSGKLELYIFNDTIPEDVFENFFTQAGIIAGVGQGRPITGCPIGNGRFRPTKFTWSDV
jgi:hypothetical protein